MLMKCKWCSILVACSPKLRLLSSSRPEQEIVVMLNSLEASWIDLRSNGRDAQIREDMEKVIKSRIAEHPRISAWPAALVDLIRETLSEKAGGM